MQEIRNVPWLTTLVMSIIFGTIGVDRFIMGHIWLGILKFLTLGFFGIWWLVDIILIATKFPFRGIHWVD
jgi:TM2 domain-containing membrane protein YozV